MRPGAGAAAVAIALAAAACAVDAPRFVDGDAGTDAAAPAGPHVEVNPATLEVGEGGQVVVRVRLSERPRAPVIVTVRASDPQRLEVAPVSLELSPASWNVERVVTVRAIGDDDADDDQVAVVFAGGGVVADGSALVAITDDDELRLVVTPAATLQVGEGGSAPVQVRLSARPRVPVTVAVSADPSGVVALAPARLTFAPTTWSVEQTVTVTGAVDLDVVDDRVKVTLAPDLDGVDRHALDVTVIDEDVLNILATPANLGTLVEGGSGRTLQVRLTQQPSGALTIALAAAPGDAVTLTPPTLDFDPATWSMPRTVTVAAPDDADVNDEQVTITLSAAGLASRTVTATVADDDVQAPVVAPTAVTLAEGQHATVGVRLAHDPGGPVQVTAAIVGADLVAVSPAQLVFTSATWAQPQAVTVTARDDEDDAGGSTTVRFGVVGGDSADLIATVSDRTVIAGFPPPHDGAPAAPAGWLHAVEVVAPPAAPACLHLDKIVVEVATLPALGPAQVQVGLYRRNGSSPRRLLFADAPRTVTTGTNRFSLSADVAIGWPMWIAIEATDGVVLAAGADDVRHCARFHWFGQPLPERFDDGAPMSCDWRRPPAVWVIARDCP
ncbi:MAG TPA: hypothetical protein VM734_12325 [Kofleriaceae bacterium]|nr:hypothetical protein [Kofleriaceae bacterium]